MNTRFLIPAAGAVLVVGVFACAGFAQQGVAEKVAEKVGAGLDKVGRGIKREAEVVSEGVRRQFETVRGEVNRMGMAPRVYSRIHWDRALNSSRIEVHSLRGGAVLLRGTVPDQAARERAVALARDTMDVNEVVDELDPLSATIHAVPAPAAKRAADPGTPTPAERPTSRRCCAGSRGAGRAR